MEPKRSLPHSQLSATCPYPEPDRSSHTPTSHFLKTRLNIILPSTSGSPKWSFSLRASTKNPVYASPLPHTCYMPRPSHYSRFYHQTNIGWAVQITKLPFYLVPLSPKYSPQHPILKHPQYSVVLCCPVYCLCVNVYCTTASGCQPYCS